MIKIEKVCKIEDLERCTTVDGVVAFLYEHLDRWRDEPSAIGKAIAYAFSEEAGKGGYLLLAYEDKQLVGVVIMNKTGMEEYVPEYLLVYIAVHKNMRGRGIGKQLLRKVFAESKGNIALHVEYDNPAKHLYEKLGFTSKYAEMRWRKE